MPLPKLRLAIVTTYPPSQGTLNEYAHHFVRFLRKKPDVGEVILLVDELPDGQSYPEETSPQPDEAPLQIIPCWRFGGWTNPLRILAAVRRTRPDGVLFNIQFATFGSGKVVATLGLLTPALVKAAGFPTIVLLHNIMETVDLRGAGFASNALVEAVIRTFGRIVTRMILRADWVAVTIPKYVEILEQTYGARNVLLAPHGSFDEVETPSFDLPPGPLQIMTFGKFGTYKKVETLIEAYKILQADGLPPLELVIAGGNSPNAPGYLEQIQQQYADVPGIRFTGYVPEEEVPRIFREAAVVVFPYTSTTGSSGVLHQAGNYGKAVVLPNIGDLAELITEEGYAGEFFEPDDPQSLAAAITRVIADPERRREMGMRNFMAARGLPIADVVDWYLLHFQELIKKKKGARTNAARSAVG